jgi:hypothetical protein
MTRENQQDVESCDLGRIIGELLRAHERLVAVEIATRRERTPGRVQILEDGDDLSSIDAHDIESASDQLGINLCEVFGRVRATISRHLVAWQAEDKRRIAIRDTLAR